MGFSTSSQLNLFQPSNQDLGNVSMGKIQVSLLYTSFRWPIFKTRIKKVSSCIS